jgi:integrase
MSKGNRPGHRRFGNVRRLPSGRYQASYIGLDGGRHHAPETFERKSDAERFLALVEVQLGTGDWANPVKARIRLGDYARVWIAERPGLRVRTMDLYRWLLAKHIDPYLGQVPVGRLSPQLVREWRANLLARGVSATMAAKAYRLLRAIMMTAAEEDKIISRNPCRIRGAGSEHAPERPVLTIAQVFELAEQVGRRPIGNVRRLTNGGHRVRYRRGGEMRTWPEVYATRADAEKELWSLMAAGRADYNQDPRYSVLVLLATFGSLRWGEATALQRCDVDLQSGTLRIRASFIERSNGEIVLGPPKSAAGRRVVGIPRAIRPALAAHMSAFVGADPGALVFPGPKGGPLRRGNFNRQAGWPHAVRAIRAEGLHFHDLRHAGNHLAAGTGAGLRDLMARMGHDSERAALIYQHEVLGADQAITDAIDARLDGMQPDDGGDGSAGAQVPGG